jgi:ribose transport system permease protein
VWQVLVALYILSAVLAALAGLLVAGLVKTASISLVESAVLPSVAAAVIGGTSIMGGRGGYAGTIVGALILTVLSALLGALDFPEAVRQILFGLIVVVVAAAYARVTGEA